jgi:hypothetical protein
MLLILGSYGGYLLMLVLFLGCYTGTELMSKRNSMGWYRLDLSGSR